MVPAVSISGISSSWAATSTPANLKNARLPNSSCSLATRPVFPSQTRGITSANRLSQKAAEFDEGASSASRVKTAPWVDGTKGDFLPLRASAKLTPKAPSFAPILPVGARAEKTLRAT
jgi:hypothetical protein